MGAVVTAAAPKSTGLWTPIIEMDSSLAAFTIYRPKDLSMGRFPIVVWGNGGCAAFGGMYREFLAEIASRGYLVISLGKFGPEDVRTWRPPAPPQHGAPQGPPPDFAPPTSWNQMIEAVDWAVNENARPQSRFAEKIETSKIALMGHSCGGLQAQRASLDPRVTTTLLLNSGAFRPGTGGAMSAMGFTSDDVVKLHAPIVYIEGGKSDLAYAQGRLNFELSRVPAMFIDLDCGHGGTYAQPHGGEYTKVAVAWLDWHLKGDTRAKQMLKDDRQGFRADPKWTIERKNWN